MDPNTVYAHILAEYDQGNIEEARYACSQLAEWLDDPDKFMPEHDRAPLIAVLRLAQGHTD